MSDFQEGSLTALETMTIIAIYFEEVEWSGMRPQDKRWDAELAASQL